MTNYKNTLLFSSFFWLLLFSACSKKEQELSDNLKGKWNISEIRFNDDSIYNDFSKGKHTIEFFGGKRAYTSTFSGVYTIDYIDQNTKDIVDTFRYDIKGDQVFLKSSELAGSGNFPLLGTDWAQSASMPPSLPDFFMRAKLGVSQWIPLERDITVLKDSSDPGSLTAGEGSRFIIDQSQGMIQAVYQNPLYLYVAVGCFVVFSVFLVVGLWRFWENRTVKI